MNSSPKLPITHPDGMAEPLVGGYVVSAPLPGKGDRSLRLGGVDGGGGSGMAVAGDGRGGSAWRL